MHCKQKDRGCTLRMDCVCLCERCSVQVRVDTAKMVSDIVQTLTKVGRGQQELAKAGADQRKALLDVMGRLDKLEKRLAAR
jgi:hypothetical protein